MGQEGLTCPRSWRGLHPLPLLPRRLSSACRTRHTWETSGPTTPRCDRYCAACCRPTFSPPLRPTWRRLAPPWPATSRRWGGRRRRSCRGCSSTTPGGAAGWPGRGSAALSHPLLRPLPSSPGNPPALPPPPGMRCWCLTPGMSSRARAHARGWWRWPTSGPLAPTRAWCRRAQPAASRPARWSSPPARTCVLGPCPPPTSTRPALPPGRQAGALRRL